MVGVAVAARVGVSDAAVVAVELGEGEAGGVPVAVWLGATVGGGVPVGSEVGVALGALLGELVGAGVAVAELPPSPPPQAETTAPSPIRPRPRRASRLVTIDCPDISQPPLRSAYGGLRALRRRHVLERPVCRNPSPADACSTSTSARHTDSAAPTTGAPVDLVRAT